MRVLLVDDHALFREGLAHVLAPLASEVEVIEAESAERALDVVAQVPDLDLVLLDVDLDGSDGMALLREIRSQRPSTPVVMISAADERAPIERALALGARGYIPKSTRGEVMIQSLRLVLAGGVYLPPELLGAQADPRDQGAHTGSTGESPTDRQRDVLNLLARGHSNKEIAGALGIAENTVRSHIASLFRTLAVSNRTEAAHAARRRGWLDDST